MTKHQLTTPDPPRRVIDRAGRLWELDSAGTYTRPTFFGCWGRGMHLDELDLEAGPC